MIRRRLSLVICLAAAAAPRGQAPAAAERAASETIARPMTIGSTEQRIEGGQEHAYTIRLEAGQFLQLRLLQYGADLALTLTGPGGRRLADSDLSETGGVGLSIIAGESGDFRLEVRAREWPTTGGHYALTLEAPRLPDDRDRRRVEAEALLAQGLKLLRDDTDETAQQAVLLFARAHPLWKALGDPLFQALCLHGEGQAHRRLDEYARARDLYQQALPLFRAGDHPPLVATTLDALGAVSLFLGESDAMRKSYGEALALHRAIGDRRGEGIALLGISHNERGQSSQALPFRAQALGLFRSVGDHRLEALALDILAYSYYRAGELQRALDTYQEALSVVREAKIEDTEAQLLSRLGMTYHVLGETDEARRCFEQSLALNRSRGDRLGEAANLMNMGDGDVAAGEVARGIPSLEQARELFRALGNQRAVAMIHVGLGNAHRKLGDLDRALELTREGLRLAEEISASRPHVQALTVLGRIYLAQGDVPKAVANLERALALYREKGDRLSEVATLSVLAQANARLGLLTRAGEHLQAALELYEASRQAVTDPELRASLRAFQDAIQGLQVDLPMQQHARDPAAGWDARAFEAAERGRVQSFLELLAQSRVDLRSGVEPALLAQEQSLQEQLRSRLEKQMRLLAGSHTEQEAATAGAEVRALRVDLRQVQGRIRTTSPRQAALTHPPSLTLAEVQQRILDPDTLLLEYVLGDERSYLFVVSPTGLRSHVLAPRADVEKAAREVHGRLASGSDRGAAAALASLSRLLLAPAAGELRGKRLLIVTEGALQYVPFAALPSPDPPRLPLLTTYETVSLPSASLLALLREETSRRRPASQLLAVFADPVFDARDERVQAAVQTASTGAPPRWFVAETAVSRDRRLGRAAGDAGLAVERIPRLPFTRREARAITNLASLKGSRVFLDFEASRDNAAGSALSDFRFVHFATHGFFDSAHPELSGLVLSLVNRDGTPQDGFVTTADVFNLKLSADLVVLSGCRTALGKDVRGEGMVGLTRAFMYAGTPRVVASLWPVDDAAAAELMTRLYQGILVEHLAPGEALRRAQLSVAGQRRWRDPYYWAAFRLEGDWN
jgi:CHAT domain-containing protein/tetratricopeptide (TPR) repeat protein